ncbi:MAG TPA: glycosyltransferase family 4 protein [Longimicrobiales bacterium]
MNWQDRLNPQAGGAEIHLHEIFGRLAARGHSVTLLTSGWHAAPRRVHIDDMEVHRVGSRNTFSVAAPQYYMRRLRQRGFDIVVEDLNKVPVFAPAWAHTRVMLLVHHLFGMTAFQEASVPFAAATWLLERPLPLAYRRVPVEAVSNSTRDDLVARGFDRDRIRVIENGVDLSYYRPDAGVSRFEAPTILYLGRLKKYKRVDLIIRAVALLRDQGVGLRMVIGGRGDAAADLRALISELNVGDRVEMLGFVTEDEKRDLFRRAWVHVLTSPKEGWGISNLEAAACSTGTIASDAPGLRDSVVHGETGFLVPHGDVPSLAAALARVASDPALRDDLGQAAYRFAQHYSWDRATDETERHLAEIVGTPQKGTTR